MGKPYSQRKALWAITRASFKAIFSQPTAIVFSLAFPIIFILIFGAFGKDGITSYRVAVDELSDTSNSFIEGLRRDPVIRVVDYTDTAKREKELQEGALTGVLTIKRLNDSAQGNKLVVNVRSTSANGLNIGALQHELDYIKLRVNAGMSPSKEEFVSVSAPVITEGKKHETIDFILPGQLGFSVLFSTLFGVAFIFFTLREQLVLKRFYASPVNRLNILLGIGTSRLFFQLTNVLVLILFGHFAFGFTLAHGALTVIELLVITVIMLFVLMGVGLIFSSIAKSDSSIPLLINLFGFPQMLLSGTFFPVTVFPKWLQEICYWLPLTQFNNATRKISFEGLHLYNLGIEIGILALWIVVVYAILSKLIRWE